MEATACTGDMRSAGGVRFRSVHAPDGRLLSVQHGPSGHWFSSVSHGCLPVSWRLSAIALVESHAFEAAALIANHCMDPMHRFAHAIAQQPYLQRGVPREAGTTKTHR